jgi:hypothetical protein
MVARFLIALAFTVTACTPVKSPELHVIGVKSAPRHESVFVQVTNPTKRPMQLTKLEYVFAAGSSTLSTGELALSRGVPANSAIVVEIPLDHEPSAGMMLRGKLTAELDEIVQIFKVSAEIQPPAK